MSTHIRYEVTGAIGTITIDRPEKRNAITYAMLNDLITVFRDAGADERSRVIILTGVPGSFCAGTDLADLATIPGTERGLRGESGASDLAGQIDPVGDDGSLVGEFHSGFLLRFQIIYI